MSDSQRAPVTEIDLSVLPSGDDSYACHACGKLFTGEGGVTEWRFARVNGDDLDTRRQIRCHDCGMSEYENRIFGQLVRELADTVRADGADAVRAKLATGYRSVRLAQLRRAEPV